MTEARLTAEQKAALRTELDDLKKERVELDDRILEIRMALLRDTEAEGPGSDDSR